MKIVAIVQARMGSTRLPGKVLFSLGNKTVLAHVVSRLQQVQGVHAVVVATSTLPQDAEIEAEAKNLKVACYRGNETNVLERYYLAAVENNADIVIRITADCPLLDATVLTQMLEKFLVCQTTGIAIDYLSNSLTRTYPRGLDAEIFTLQALKKTYEEATFDYQLEHVTPYIYQNPDKFALHNFANAENLSQYRLTLDTVEDMEMLRNIFLLFDNHTESMTTTAIVAALQKNPWLMEINQHVEQKLLHAIK